MQRKLFYYTGDRVRVTDWGLGTIISDWRVYNAEMQVPRGYIWVKLDCGDNPVKCVESEVTPA